MEQGLPNNLPKAPNPEPDKAINGDYKNAKDLTLTRAIGEGDDQAFEEIYNRYQRRIYSLCLKMLKNTHDAEDVTQDVFLQLSKKAGSFNGDSAFTTWLHRFTVNQVLMHFRKKSVKNDKKAADESEEKLENIVVPGTNNPNKMSVVDKIALNDALAEMGKTASGYKDVLTLHDIEGHEHEEVARILGITAGTSKSQLSKARLRMQKLLQKKANPRLYHDPDSSAPR